MKYLKKITLFLLISIVSFSCKVNSVQITGSLPENSNLKTITLRQGETIVQEIAVNDEHTFNLEMKTLVKGYYKLNKTLVYLAPGFNFDVNFASDSIIFNGKGANENRALQQIYKNEKNYQKGLDEKYSLNSDEFKAYLGKHVSWTENQLSKEKLDADFIRIEKRKAHFFVNGNMPNYTFNHGVDHALEREAFKFFGTDEKKFDSIYNESTKNQFSKIERQKINAEAFKDFSWNDEELFLSNSSGYSQLLNKKISTLSYQVLGKGTVPKLVRERDIILDSIKNKEIRVFLLKNRTLNIIKTHSEYADEAYGIYKKENPSKVNLEEINQSYSAFTKIAKGNPSALFVDYKTPNDGKVSLKDFLGKYVYIDVWATWCGPCKKEIPFLKKIEKKYHGKNIEFVSISVDVEKQRQKWKDMVKDMGLTGTQIMADKDFKSDFIKAYNIAAIPRFILIDPSGNIVSPDALRPSDPKLIEFFNELGI